jgi:16S rRNA processing protein RimM
LGVTAQPVVLGRISGLFGVRGWVKVYSYTDPREAVLEYNSWLLSGNDGWQEASVAEGQRHGKTVIARIDGYDDRDKAAGLIGTEIGVPRNWLPETDAGQYYWGANDVMVVKGEQECLIPFVMDKVVLGVDLAKGEIRVDWEWD